MPVPIVEPRVAKRSAAKVSPRVTPAVPDVPLWFICTQQQVIDLRCESTFNEDASLQTGAMLQIAFHGDVGALAVAVAGVGRADLAAVALDARALDGSGPSSPIRVGLCRHGKARVELAVRDGLADAVVVVEPLRPTANGYREPDLRTAGDVERTQNRDRYRRGGSGS